MKINEKKLAQETLKVYLYIKKQRNNLNKKQKNGYLHKQSNKRNLQISRSKKPKASMEPRKICSKQKRMEQRNVLQRRKSYIFKKLKPRTNENYKSKYEKIFS